MIQQGQITAEEGAQLFEALSPPPRVEEEIYPRDERPVKKSYQIHIRITDLETEREKVNFRMPLNLIEVGTHMGARLAHEEIKLEEITAAAQAGVEGKVMNIVDEEERERIEIFIETGLVR